VEKKDRNPDPEAVALAKVYALLKRVAQQHRATQAQAEGDTEKESVQSGDETEAPQSGNPAHVQPLTPE
jgi:hypothetical protein